MVNNGARALVRQPARLMRLRMAAAPDMFPH